MILSFIHSGYYRLCMKNTMFAGILIALFFSSCQQNETDYAALLYGTWVNTMVDGDSILTDASYVLEFKLDQTELYASGFQLNDSNKTWLENTSYTYSVDDNIITIDGVDVLDKEYHMEFVIQSLDNDNLTYTVRQFLIDGVTCQDSKTYTCKRAENNDWDLFEGIWYGHCTTIGTTDTLYHYWKYNADSTYLYYYQNTNSEWVCKSDNEGRYFLYGDLFVSNYSNDLLSGGTGKAYECWSFVTDGLTMTWTGRRADGIVTYSMEKVSDAPTVVL